MEYKIIGVRTSLPSDLTEKDHLSVYIHENGEPLTRCIDPTRKKFEKHLSRNALTAVMILEINKKQVWVKLSEWDIIEPIFKEATKIFTMWYVAGSSTPYFDSGDTTRASTIDGYEVHIIYK